MKNKLLNKIFNFNRNDLPISSLRSVALSDLRQLTRYGQTDDYDNAYSSITAIADQFIQIPIYAIDSNGAKIEQTPNAIKRISIPNTEMDGISFKDMLAKRTMVYDKTYVLVHERYGTSQTRPASERVKEERIAGYTFLDGVVEHRDDMGRLTYKVWRGTEEVHYYPYQVMTFYDTNPSAVGQGYSPVRAAKRWSRIEDYIADYQAGFFENGAVPAGQFLITAPSTTEFDDIVDNLEKKHRGAGANNNVVYTYQPIDPNTGKTAQASITWVPFNTTNKDLSLKDILAATNAKTDSVYRVSAMQRAITDAPNFATAQVDDRNFIEKTIRPFTLKRWQRFQHELNRITGGLGYGISFKLETPYIAEEDKARAETNKIIWETIKDMMADGFTYDSACNALKLPANWKTLEVGESKETNIENDKADVATDDEIEDLPKPTSMKTPVKYKAEYDVETIEAELIPFENSISDILEDNIRKQIDAAMNVANASDEEDMTEEIVAILLALMALRGNEVYSDGVTMAMNEGIPVESGEYVPDITEDERVKLEGYVKSFNDQTAKDIEAIKNNPDTSVIAGLLTGYLISQDWRVKRFSRNEAWTYSELSGNQAINQLEEKISGYFTKTWVIQPGACPLCTPLSGETVRVNQPFSNGLEYPPVHVACRCTVERQVVREVNNSVKELHCKECDRFLGETTQIKYNDKLKCSNSKCKALKVPVVKEKK